LAAINNKLDHQPSPPHKYTQYAGLRVGYSLAIYNNAKVFIVTAVASKKQAANTGDIHLSQITSIYYFYVQLHQASCSCLVHLQITILRRSNRRRLRIRIKQLSAAEQAQVVRAMPIQMRRGRLPMPLRMSALGEN
jgi:hypothetical protein